MKKIALALAAAAALPTSANAALFQNGSFESGTVDPGSFTTINAGDSTSITGWTVTSGSVDYIGSYWTASQGNRSIDLSGNEPGVLSQTFDTVAGQNYLVTFDLGGNGDGQPDPKNISVSAGAGSQNFSAPSSTIPGINYTPKSYFFTASGTSTTLSFSALDGGPYGAALDNVSVAAVPEPATWGMMILGFGVVGGAMRRRRSAALAAA